MKISLSWLRQYVSLTHSPSAIEEALTLIGFEVEGVEKSGCPPLSQVVVGEVVERARHPDADRLSVCRVRVSASEEPVQIVCGASNFREGDRVPVALPGAVLPGDFKIKKSKLRGVASEGMMCSARELNLGEDHSGLLILESRPEVGTPVNDVLPPEDVIFDVEVTPNRPDCLSHLGIARELAAFFDLPLQYPEVRGPDLAGLAAESASQPHLLNEVKIEDSDGCPRYTAWSVRGVKVGQSPEWLQERLRAVGLRPINNVVDVTNFVLLETGQPLHAFDAARIRGQKLTVRAAFAGEKLLTLDEKERTLISTDLVIADEERALVLAGIMGAVDAGVSAETCDVVLEVAAFDPSRIRATARRIGLSTDSSYRFERGVDPFGLHYTALRCLDLLQECAGGDFQCAPIERGSLPISEVEICIHPDEVRRFIGFEVSDDAIESAWSRLELDVVRGDDDEPWRVGVPTFRGDLLRRADLMEEFLRIHGTDKIPSGGLSAAPPSVLPDHPADTLGRQWRQFLVARGFAEAYHYSLRDAGEVTQWAGHSAADALELANPLASDQSHLRNTLLGGLLDTLRHNYGRNRGDFRFFEVGRIFREVGDEIREYLAVALVVLEPARERAWNRRSPSDFFSVRQWIDTLVAKSVAAAGDMLYQSDQLSPMWDTERAGRKGMAGEGWQVEAGYLSAAVVKKWGLRDPVLAAEFLLDPAVSNTRQASRYQPVSVHPPAVKDLAVLVQSGRPAGLVQQELLKLAGETCGGDFAVEAVEQFDLYEGEGLPAGQKSLGFSIVYRSAVRTLDEKEVGVAFNALQKAVDASGQMAVRR